MCSGGGHKRVRGFTKLDCCLVLVLVFMADTGGTTHITSVVPPEDGGATAGSAFNVDDRTDSSDYTMRSGAQTDVVQPPGEPTEIGKTDQGAQLICPVEGCGYTATTKQQLYGHKARMHSKKRGRRKNKKLSSIKGRSGSKKTKRANVQPTERKSIVDESVHTKKPAISPPQTELYKMKRKLRVYTAKISQLENTIEALKSNHVGEIEIFREGAKSLRKDLKNARLRATYHMKQNQELNDKIKQYMIENKLLKKGTQTLQDEVNDLNKTRTASLQKSQKNNKLKARNLLRKTHKSTVLRYVSIPPLSTVPPPLTRVLTTY